MKDPFEIIVTTEYGININLSNQSPKWEKSYSNFITIEEAEFFADTLERIIKTAAYTDRVKCAHCGKYLSKADKLYRMENGEYMHTKCFYRAYEEWHEHIESREYVDAITKGGDAKLDFTNLNAGNGYRIAFSIEVVSKKAIHIVMRPREGGNKNHFCFTYTQCVRLVEEIRRKIKAIEDSRRCICQYCEKTIHVDQTHFIFSSGEAIHEKCMGDFIQKFESKNMRLPARRIRANDIFGHISLFSGRR